MKNALFAIIISLVACNDINTESSSHKVDSTVTAFRDSTADKVKPIVKKIGVAVSDFKDSASKKVKPVIKKVDSTVHAQKDSLKKKIQRNREQ